MIELQLAINYTLQFFHFLFFQRCFVEAQTMRSTTIRKQSVKKIIITYNLNECSVSKHTSTFVTVLLAVELLEIQSVYISKFHAPLPLELRLPVNFSVFRDKTNSIGILIDSIATNTDISNLLRIIYTWQYFGHGRTTQFTK